MQEGKICALCGREVANPCVVAEPDRRLTQMHAPRGCKELGKNPGNSQGLPTSLVREGGEISFAPIKPDLLERFGITARPESRR